MQYSIELNVNGKKEQASGDMALNEILEKGDGMISKAIRESE